MSLSSLRVIVVTTKSDLYNLIRSATTSESNVEMVINVRSMNEVENKLVRTMANVVILDVDNGDNDHVKLQLLLGRYKLLIILTGRNNIKAIPLMKGNIRDFVPQPQTASTFSNGNYINVVLSKMRMFATAHGQKQPGTGGMNAAIGGANFANAVGQNQRIIAIAASTGGTEALEKVFRALPPDCPPVVVVQHMPSGFTKLFADRLNLLCRATIKEGASGDYLLKGQVLIAPADFHMILVKHGMKMGVDCYKGVRVHGVMPAADILFDSVAALMRQNAVGVVLTGMGSDGAKGLLKMHVAGARTIGQDEKSCVVYGMPKAAFDIGAVDYQLPIDNIAAKIMELAR